MRLAIRQAGHEDVATITQLLREALVSAEGVEEHVGRFLLIEEAEAGVIGTVGMEVLEGRYGLLRSLVVKRGMTSAQIGAEMIALFIAYVETTDVEELYLLTQSTTAPLFIHIGFSTIDKEQLPQAVAQCQHFLAYSQQEAVAMVKKIASTSYPHSAVDSVNK